MDFENHPIPQDVTGFKFKLIGSITVRQFLYLFVSGVFAYFFWAFPIHVLLKIPLVFFSLTTGFSLAFIPIEGRAMDKMIINFIKSIPSENRYIYRKRGVEIYAFQFVQKPVSVKTMEKTAERSRQTQIRKEILLSQITSDYSGMDKEEEVFMKNIKVFFGDTNPLNSTKRTMPNLVRHEESYPKESFILKESSKEKDESIKIDTQAEEIKQQLDRARELQQKMGDSEDLERKIKELQGLLQKTLQEKERLERKMFGLGENKVLKSFEENGENKNPLIKKIDPGASEKAGFPSIPDVPNVILGIVKDPRGKVLPNILVEVMDKDNIPVRAFKTNMLGQFASATPLLNGRYKISFEDPQKRNGFDTIEVELKGEIFYPLEVMSIDARERLRRELFENSN